MLGRLFSQRKILARNVSAGNKHVEKRLSECGVGGEGVESSPKTF